VNNVLVVTSENQGREPMNVSDVELMFPPKVGDESKFPPVLEYN
jgi:hypothetical protein